MPYETVEELREVLRKVANCLGCQGCRSVARTALGVTHQDFVYRGGILPGNPPSDPSFTEQERKWLREQDANAAEPKGWMTG